ncbi:hypothetical protein LMG22037_03470 [Paraburkholderia phenoliruptrix]|nr:hypothetical protein [Paraburkholderia phenoliruptrix]CAB3700364.1 hypothetical protein LMG22037_03470 [Paraburkholderia phenoliruptrix]CAB4046705.1 hypothetical protein LMG9964_00336 [Paraburkholderia phenoliruptrix]
MKVGPRLRPSGSAALATDAGAAEPPGWTVAAGITIITQRAKQGRNRRER